jgi:hypothetical protein
MGGSVLVWLEAELARVEELARAATPGPWEPEEGDPTDDEVYSVCEEPDLVGDTVAYTRGRSGTGWQVGNMMHIAAWGPDVVLRRVAAERELLAEHRSTHGLGYVGRDYVGMDSVCTSCGTADEYGVPWPCRTVLLLAEGYGWKEREAGCPSP